MIVEEVIRMKNIYVIAVYPLLMLGLVYNPITAVVSIVSILLDMYSRII